MSSFSTAASKPQKRPWPRWIPGRFSPVEKNNPVWPARYALLDGLRGIAALVVVMDHLNAVSDEAGHLAVMVFFVISGYCITASAEACRRNGVGFKAFMQRRIGRIFPPYLLAVAFFVTTRIVKDHFGLQTMLSWTPIQWLQNLTLTQWISNLSHPVSAAFENHTLFVAGFWSLNYEEQFYLVMAGALVLASRRNVPLIVPVAALSLIGLVWNFAVPGNWICGFFVEYWIHFALGACLFLCLSLYADHRIRSAFAVLVVLLGAISLLRLQAAPGQAYGAMRSMLDLSFLAAVTLTLFLLRPLSARITGFRLWKPLAALGTISYSLYLIHQFNLVAVSYAASRLLPSGAPKFLFLITETLLFLLLATGFWWCCERPFVHRRPPSRAPASVGAANPEPV
jgi:peptidoglycan/LPS O-acetylase OafA/YrhL